MKKATLLTLLVLVFCVLSAQNEMHEKPGKSKQAKEYFGLRVGLGVDPVIIPNGLAGFYIMPVSNEKIRITIDNLFAVSVPWMVYERYYYPSIRVYFKHKNIWLGVSYGKEFSKVTDLFDNPGEEVTRIINHRMDIGLVHEINRHFNFEWNLPVRIDDEIPVYATGIIGTLIYKF